MVGLPVGLYLMVTLTDWLDRWQTGRGYNDDKKLVEEIAGRNSPLWPQDGGPIELVLGNCLFIMFLKC